MHSDHMSQSFSGHMFEPVSKPHVSKFVPDSTSESSSEPIRQPAGAARPEDGLGSKGFKHGSLKAHGDPVMSLYSNVIQEP